MRNYPFLRLLLPLITGIACADYLFFKYVGIPEIPLSVVLFSLFILFVATSFIKRYRWRWMPGVIVFFFFLFLGFASTKLQLNSTVYEFSAEKIAYRAKITSDGNIKARSILYNADIMEGFDSLAFPVNKKVLLYLAPDSLSSTLERGDEILFYGNLALPRNNGNPDEFDYPRYLIRKGVSSTTYIPSSQWVRIPRSAPVSFQESAYQCRDKVLNIYRKYGFEGEEFAVLSALTVGYKDELSEDIRESFSVSGVSHVLALSGLHVGFIFWLLFAIFKRTFGSSVPALMFRSFIIILALWFFAFMTGLSPSVVRSVLMFSLLAITSARSGRLFTFHSLSLTAFLMLVYNPGWLFDVGFQLSFIAVAGIILVQPRLYKLLNPTNWLFRYVWEVLTVSTAAQIATAPLVVFYFSRFATHFLLTNLLVIPLVTFIIYGAVLLLMFPMPWWQQIIAVVVRLLIQLLNTIVRWVEQLPFASIDNLWLTPAALVIIYFVLLLIATTGKKHRGRQALCVLGCLFFLAVHGLWVHLSKPDYPSIAFYNVRNCPVVHCIDGDRKSWLVCIDSLSDNDRLYKTLSSHWTRRGINQPEKITGDYTRENLIRTENLLFFSGKSVYILNDNQWEIKYSDQPFNVDYLYICNGFTQKIEPLRQLFSIQCVILDSSLSGYRREAFVTEIRQLGIPYISLTDGAFIFRVE